MGFNYKEYLKTSRLYGSYKVNGDIEIIARNNLTPFSIFINYIREKTVKNIHEILPKEESGILIGLILGNKKDISDESKETFKLSNMMHILAVSGMHISYIILGLTYVFKRIPIRKRYLIIVICLLFFMALTKFQPSVVRATLMASMILIAKLIHRKEDFLTAIFLSLLILTLYNPYIILNLGLQLSFLGTLGIVIFSKNISNILLKKFNSKLSNILAVSISVQILILPISIYNFNIISISFVFSGFICAFLVGIIFILGFIFVLVSFISIKLSKWISILLSFLIKILSLSAEGLANFKILNHFVKTPTIIIIAIYYLIVLSTKYISSLLNKRNFRRYERKIVKTINMIGIKKIILAVSLVIMFLSFFFTIYKLIPKDLKINFIDVGQGDSTLIITPKGKTILVDGGEDEDIVFNYLLDRGVTKLDYILISHFDSDHVRWYF